MRVAFLLWPIAEEGGLATHAQALILLHRRMGIEANFYRLHYTDKLHGQAQPIGFDVNANSGLRLQGRHLSITDAKLPETLSYLDRYDQLVFVHPCPHVSDVQTGNKAVNNWRRLYTYPEAGKSVFFSDVYALDYYPFIEEVIDRFRPLAVNDAIARYVKDSLGVEPEVLPHPWVEMPRRINKWRSQIVLWTAAWRGWKGIKRFCAAVPDIEAIVRLYGTGRELRQFRKAMPPDWPGEIVGAVAPETVLADYVSAYCSVDLTGQSAKYFGHYNRTTLEPMLYGCVSVTLPTLVEPFSRIPKDVVWTVEKDAVADGINELLHRPNTAFEIRERAHAWVRETCNDEVVLNSLWASASTGRGP